MITDPKELKKTALILSEIFNIACEIRGKAYANAVGKTTQSDIEDYIASIKNEIAMDIEHAGTYKYGSSGYNEIELYPANIFDKYNWDILSFFKTAAQPIMNLTTNADYKEDYDNPEDYISDLDATHGDGEGEKYLKSITRTEEDVEKDAQQGMEKLEAFISSL